MKTVKRVAFINAGSVIIATVCGLSGLTVMDSLFVSCIAGALLGISAVRYIR